MSEIKLVKSDEFGYGFVPAGFLGSGEDEYRFRNLQSPPGGRSWRPLTSDEIEILVKNDNSCTNWYNILVADPFNPLLIQNTLFAGLVRLGPIEDVYLKYHDFMVPAGITNSRIISCDIGANCAIHNVAYLSHYILGDSVILSRIDEMACTNHAKFGQGVIKEGEDESVRIWIDPINEAGGRSVLPFDGMICADAWLWAIHRDDAPLMKKLAEITQTGVDARRGWYGEVGDGAIIKSCQVIKDVKIGPGAYVKGANKLKNLTINSSHAESTQIGEGVELVNGIVGYGCHIFYGVKAVRFVLGNNSNLKYGARLIHSILGDNSTVSCCELLNNLVFPGHEQHHNNSFLIATLVMGQSNLAAGATVGSNHNSRGNDGEIFAGRGFWPGLSSTLKHNCRFGSYTLLTKGNYPSELNVRMPFSMISDNHRADRIDVMPAYWWMYNMYALERNSWKYRSRDRRKTIVQRIETDHLAPDTAGEIFDALACLELWTAKAWYQARKPDAPLPDDQSLCARGRELLSKDRSVVDELFVVGENIERSKRPARILKPSQAWNAYRDMLCYYGVKAVCEYLAASETDFVSFNRTAAGTGERVWVNMGGQLVPSVKLEALRQDIRSGALSSWQEIHAAYERWWSEYPQDKARNALFALEYLSDGLLDAKSWNTAVDRAVEIRSFIEEQVYVTKKKDYTNFFREITYRNEAERDAVLGKVEDNSFIKTAREDTSRFIALAASLRAPC